MIATAWSGPTSGTHISRLRTTYIISLWSSLCRITAYGGRITGRVPTSGRVWISGVDVVIAWALPAVRAVSAGALRERHQRGCALDALDPPHAVAQDRRDLGEVVHLDLTHDIVRPHHLVHLGDLVDRL